MILRAMILLFCLVLLTEQRSTPSDVSYVAAVVEYEVNTNVTENLKNYVMLIKEAADQNADIIVFPELTLIRDQRSIPIPVNGLLKDHPVPALRPDLYDEVLVTVSKAALENQMYVLINTPELLDCNVATEEYCPELKQYVFNTNIVFDRTGAIIERYRKINLFGELSRTPALKPDLGVFTTDFGVTFGHFICFDLLFQVPGIQVAQKHNLTDVITTTMWFSELPYLSAIEIQLAYAYSLNVNFLASGANDVQFGSAGSGIYSGRFGALISAMPGVPTTRLLVAEVPKQPGKVNEGLNPSFISDDPQSLDNLLLYRDPSLQSHVTRPLEEGFQEFVLTSREVTCKFIIKLRTGEGAQVYKYMAAAFDGTRSFKGGTTIENRICSVFSCTGSTIDTCGRRFLKYKANSTAAFEELYIEALAPTPQFDVNLGAADSTFFPVSLDITLMPLRSQYYNYDIISSDNTCRYILQLISEVDGLYSFGIRGGVSLNDSNSITESKNNASFYTPVLILLLPILYTI